jgi:hypothetical protein
LNEEAPQDLRSFLIFVGMVKRLDIIVSVYESHPSTPMDIKPIEAYIMKEEAKDFFSLYVTETKRKVYRNRDAIFSPIDGSPMPEF